MIRTLIFCPFTWSLYGGLSCCNITICLKLFPINGGPTDNNKVLTFPSELLTFISSSERHHVKNKVFQQVTVEVLFHRLIDELLNQSRDENIPKNFEHQLQKMVKHTQTIRRQQQTIIIIIIWVDGVFDPCLMRPIFLFFKTLSHNINLPVSKTCKFWYLRQSWKNENFRFFFKHMV